MVKNQGSRKQEGMVVTIRHVATPDGTARLSHAISILLKGAAEANPQAEDTSNGKEEAPYGQAPTKDANDRKNSMVKDSTNSNCGPS